MRDDGDFLSDLRKEMVAIQDRRHRFVLAKLAFVTALLGVGFAAGEVNPTLGRLLLLVPVVTFVFDLCVLGEDFAARRIVKFLTLSDGVPPLEVSWEIGVRKVRDRFGDHAVPLSSALALVAAAMGYFAVVPLAVAIACTVVGAAFVAVGFLSPRRHDKLLERLAPALRTRRPRRKKKRSVKRMPAPKPVELNGESVKPQQQPLLPL